VAHKQQHAPTAYKRRKKTRLSSRERERTPASFRHNVKVRKTRRPKLTSRVHGSLVTNADVNRLSTAEKRRLAVDMRKEGHALIDIGEAIGVSQPRVSQMLKEFYEEITASNLILGTHLLTEELHRLDALILAWYRRGKVDPRAAEVLFKFISQRHKLSGLEVTKTDMNLRGGPIHLTASSIDITKLDARMLANLDEIMRVAGNLPPNIEGMPEVPQLEYLDEEIPLKKHKRK
jgi:hypothetical protein